MVFSVLVITLMSVWPRSHLMYQWEKGTDIFTWGVLKISGWMLPQYLKSIFKGLSQLVLFNTGLLEQRQNPPVMKLSIELYISDIKEGFSPTTLLTWGLAKSLLRGAVLHTVRKSSSIPVSTHWIPAALTVLIIEDASDVTNLPQGTRSTLIEIHCSVICSI